MPIAASVRRWLLEPSEPSVRVRVLTDLYGRRPSDPAVRSARAAITKTGWISQILAEQLPQGQWLMPGVRGPDLYRPKYLATNWRMIVLAELGAPPRDPRVRKGLARFRKGFGGRTGGFGGTDSEVCITGNAARVFARLSGPDDPDLRTCLDWLVAAQKSDGGWHCFPSRHGTLDGWEAMAAFAALPPERRTAQIGRAIERGAEFYLERGLLREGPGRYTPWYRLHYPTHYYYDYLVGLDFLTALGFGGDRRLRPALDRLERARRPDGRWNLEAVHPDLGKTAYRLRRPVYPWSLEPVGEPSKWITTTALLVLRRAGRS